MRVEQMDARVEGQEKMKLIPGSNDYFITEDARVYSFSGVGSNPKRRTTPIELRPAMVRGYPAVEISIRGERKKSYIHSLMLETFIGPCPDGCECRHLDGNKLNNNLSNLAWGTYQQNQKDRESHGTTNRGERQGRSKLTSADVHEIRRMARSGKVDKGERGTGYAGIANKFNVSAANIAQIMRKKSWFWLEEKK